MKNFNLLLALTVTITLSVPMTHAAAGPGDKGGKSATTSSIGADISKSKDRQAEIIIQASAKGAAALAVYAPAKVWEKAINGKAAYEAQKAFLEAKKAYAASANTVEAGKTVAREITSIEASIETAETSRAGALEMPQATEADVLARNAAIEAAESRMAALQAELAAKNTVLTESSVITEETLRAQRDTFFKTQGALEAELKRIKFNINEMQSEQMSRKTFDKIARGNRGSIPRGLLKTLGAVSSIWAIGDVIYFANDKDPGLLGVLQWNAEGRNAHYQVIKSVGAGGARMLADGAEIGADALDSAAHGLDEIAVDLEAVDEGNAGPNGGSDKP